MYLFLLVRMFKTWYDEYSAPGQNKEKLRQETGGGG